MKNISKADKARRDGIIEKLREAWAKVEAAHGDAAEAMEKLNSARDDFNEIVNEAIGFRDDMVSEIDSYISEKSEKWQDGDTGQEFSSWKDAWEGLELDEVEQFEMPDLPDVGHADTLEQAPEEPGAS